jgi:hypothetical protein
MEKKLENVESIEDKFTLYIQKDRHRSHKSIHQPVSELSDKIQSILKSVSELRNGDAFTLFMYMCEMLAESDDSEPWQSSLLKMVGSLYELEKNKYMMW